MKGKWMKDGRKGGPYAEASRCNGRSSHLIASQLSFSCITASATYVPVSSAVPSSTLLSIGSKDDKNVGAVMSTDGGPNKPNPGPVLYRM